VFRKHLDPDIDVVVSAEERKLVRLENMTAKLDAAVARLDAARISGPPSELLSPKDVN
jgi:hypothetical protein